MESVLPNQVTVVEEISDPPIKQMPVLPTDNTRSLISVQTQIYNDMNAVLLDIYGMESLIVCRQFRIQNIIQKHFIEMRKNLQKEIQKAIQDVANAKRPWWKRLFRIA
jgi:hypothetical protein